MQRVAVGVVAKAAPGLRGQGGAAERAGERDDLLGVETPQPHAMDQMVLRQTALPPGGLGRGVVARRDDDEDLVAAQPPADEHERAPGGVVDPLGVVDHDHHRSGGLQPAEHGQQLRAHRQRVRVGRRSRGEERPAQPVRARRRRAGPAPRTRARSRPPRRCPTGRRRRAGRRAGGGRARSSRCPRDRSATGRAAARTGPGRARPPSPRARRPGRRTRRPGTYLPVCRRLARRGTAVTAPRGEPHPSCTTARRTGGTALPLGATNRSRVGGCGSEAKLRLFDHEQTTVVRLSRRDATGRPSHEARGRSRARVSSVTIRSGAP